MSAPVNGADEREPVRCTAADGKTEVFNIPGYPLMVRAVDFNAFLGAAQVLNGWNEAIEAAAKRIEGGSFLHDKSPAKLFANELAPVIRSMKRAPIAAGAAQASAAEDGYTAAFYELVALMGISAQPISPERVWREQMLPRLREALACAAQVPSLSDKQVRAGWENTFSTNNPFCP